MTMKEKVESILGKFLYRNKDYDVNAYIRNGITGNSITGLFIPINRTAKSEDKKYSVRWKVDSVTLGDLAIPYNEVMDCYEERDEYGSQVVYVILKNGMIIELECCGERR